MRKACLERCLASLQTHYPDVPYVVVDTEGNTSLGRKRTVELASTEYVMLCEDDLEFDAQVRLSDLIAVLDHDGEIGGTAGVLRQRNGQPDLHYYANLRRFRGELRQERPSDWRETPGGIPYVACDLLSNAGVWRREVFSECPFDVELEVEEHKEWFWRLQCGERWRCAFVPTSSIIHYSDHSDPAYRRMLYRGKFKDLAEAKIGAKLQQFRGFAPVLHDSSAAYGVTAPS
jgi:hypothetical protein